MRELHGHRRALLTLLGLVPLACLAQGTPAVPAARSSALLERGRYLATLADCAACHEDPQGHEPFAGGRPLETPFGSIVAPNITPDPSTGIGAGAMPSSKRRCALAACRAVGGFIRRCPISTTRV